MKRFPTFFASIAVALFCILALVLPSLCQTPDVAWIKIDANTFSLNAPKGWELHQDRGIDSYVGKFVGDDVTLHFDYGHYSNPLDEAAAPKYSISYERVGGRKAKIVSPRGQEGLTAIYFPKVNDSDKLCVWANNLTEGQRNLVLRILRTIRFP